MATNSSEPTPKSSALDASAQQWVERLCDEDERRRNLAVHALQIESSNQVYDAVTQACVALLKEPAHERQALILEVLGLLRDEKMVVHILPHVISTKPRIAMAAQSALALLCAQCFGSDTASWAHWWETNRSESRKRWLLDALTGKDPILLGIAQKELKLLKGQSE